MPKNYSNRFLINSSLILDKNKISKAQAQFIENK